MIEHVMLALPAALIPLVSAGIGAAASVGSALLAPKPKAPPVPGAPPPPAPTQQPAPSPSQDAATGAPSFLAAAAAPAQANQPGKTLLGQ